MSQTNRYEQYPPNVSRKWKNVKNTDWKFNFCCNGIASNNVQLYPKHHQILLFQTIMVNLYFVQFLVIFMNDNHQQPDQY